MKFTLKLIAASLALAAAGQANATIASQDTPGNIGGAEMFLAVWDSGAQKSYVRDLGVKFNDFLPAAGLGATTGFSSQLDKTSLGNIITSTARPVAGTVGFAAGFGAAPSVELGSVLSSGYSLSFAPDPLLASFLGTAGSLSTSLQWMVGAFDNTGNTVVNGRRALTTSNGAVAINNLSLGNFSSGSAGYITANNGIPTMGSGTATNGSATAVKADGSAYFDTAGFPMSSWGNNAPFSNLAAVGTSQKFVFLGVSSSNGSDAAIVNPFTGASWNLDAAGNLTYAVAPVPVPAAVWLFASGVLGLVSVARRRLQS